MDPCIRMHEEISWWDWQCTYGVCNRALGCFYILNALLHVSQVYVYVRLTNQINLFQNASLQMLE
jgi:hypothetical protein